MSWRLWSSREGLSPHLPAKRPPKPSPTRRVEVSPDGVWLEVIENSVVVEVYTWVPERASGAAGAVRRAAGRTGT
jgi:hypothetical protein